MPLMLRGHEKSPDDKRRNEVRDAWRKPAKRLFMRSGEEFNTAKLLSEKHLANA
ncbi:hypothetical protein ACYZT3_23580 [Pseudomonas sp. MDT1-16]|uniref:hypothetical protein n=1 Tax=Pseudomonas sp. AL03 TaxID=3042230 RepID=UPI00249B6B35|nr:hypothetical protein [Pseudomonas sp. AL03]MDI3272595.1 hypothetical protein [Pseudomonas sp. AL03]